MTEQIEERIIEVQSPSQMQRLFKTRDAALNFAKFICEGDVLIQGGMVDGKKVWQLTYIKREV